MYLYICSERNCTKKDRNMYHMLLRSYHNALIQCCTAKTQSDVFVLKSRKWWGSVHSNPIYFLSWPCLALIHSVIVFLPVKAFSTRRKWLKWHSAERHSALFFHHHCITFKGRNISVTVALKRSLLTLWLCKYNHSLSFHKVIVSWSRTFKCLHLNNVKRNISDKSRHSF